jgi:hypothetical protein
LAQGDKMFITTDRTICWLQNSLNFLLKVLFAPLMYHISAIEPELKNLEPTNCSNNHSETSIQPKLSLDFVVEGYIPLGH